MITSLGYQSSWCRWCHRCHQMPRPSVPSHHPPTSMITSTATSPTSVASSTSQAVFQPPPQQIPLLVWWTKSDTMSHDLVVCHWTPFSLPLSHSSFQGVLSFSPPVWNTCQRKENEMMRTTVRWRSTSFFILLPTWCGRSYVFADSPSPSFPLLLLPDSHALWNSFFKKVMCADETTSQSVKSLSNDVVVDIVSGKGWKASCNKLTFSEHFALCCASWLCIIVSCMFELMNFFQRKWFAWFWTIHAFICKYVDGFCFGRDHGMLTRFANPCHLNVHNQNSSVWKMHSFEIFFKRAWPFWLLTVVHRYPILFCLMAQCAQHLHIS